MDLAVQWIGLRRRAMVRGVEILGLARDVSFVALDVERGRDEQLPPPDSITVSETSRVNGPLLGSSWADDGTQ